MTPPPRAPGPKPQTHPPTTSPRESNTHPAVLWSVGGGLTSPTIASSCPHLTPPQLPTPTGIKKWVALAPLGRVGEPVGGGQRGAEATPAAASGVGGPLSLGGVTRIFSLFVSMCAAAPKILKCEVRRLG